MYYEIKKIKDYLNYHREPFIKHTQEDLELKGKVKSVEYRKYNAYENPDGGVIKGRKLAHLRTFFDEKGRFTKQIDDTDATKICYFYNENGGFEKIEECNENGECYLLNTFRYDEKGNMVAQNYILPNGEFWDREKYEYNKQGKITAINHLTDHHQVYERKRYTYDGNTILERGGWGRDLRDGERYTYDENGKLIKVEWRDYKYFDFIYDENGNLAMFKECYCGNGEVNQRYTIKYDEHDNIIEILLEKKHIKKKSGKEHINFQYEYDQHGNWTQCIIIKNGEIDEVRSREIAYFD